MTTLAGQRALITGASSGLGADFARQLAAMGCHLVLVARRIDRLEALAAELRAAHGVGVEVIGLDLGLPDSAQSLFDRLQAAGLAIDLLINNAGFGLYGRFVEQDLARITEMMRLNMLTLTQLCHLYARQMRTRGSGYILNVASIGGYAPTPLYAVYAATKSFVLDFSDALAYELQGSGVSVTCVCPGVTQTEFLSTSGQTPTLYQRFAMMSSEVVVKQAIAGMLRRRRSFVTGLLNALMIWSLRLTPRFLQIRAAELMMK
jgi:short-subunit dehydrogenase